MPGLCKWVTSSLPPPLRLAEETRSSSLRWRNVILGSRSCRAYIGPGSLWTTVDWATTRGHHCIVNFSWFVQLSQRPCCTWPWRQAPVHPEVHRNIQSEALNGADAIYVFLWKEKFLDRIWCHKREGLIKLGPGVPDGWRVTLSRRRSGNLKSWEDPHTFS